MELLKILKFLSIVVLVHNYNFFIFWDIFLYIPSNNLSAEISGVPYFSNELCLHSFDLFHDFLLPTPSKTKLKDYLKVFIKN